MSKYNMFCAGGVFVASIISLHQDILGQAGYIEHIKNHWIDGTISVPIAIGSLVLVSYAMYKDLKNG